MSTETKHWHLFARDVLAQIAYLCDIPATKAKNRADVYLAVKFCEIERTARKEAEAEIARLQGELSHERDVIEEQAQVIIDLTEALARQRLENAELRKSIVIPSWAKEPEATESAASRSGK